MCVHAASRAAVKAPAIDGALGLPISRTPFDAEWDRVKDAKLPTTGPAAAAIASRVPEWLALPKSEQFRQVNKFVNDYMTYVRDNQLWSKVDFWATPREALVDKKGRGDW